MSAPDLSGMGVDTQIKGALTMPVFNGGFDRTSNLAHRERLSMTPERGEDGLLTPEANLWVAVLRQAFDDAMWVDPKIGQPIDMLRVDDTNPLSRREMIAESAKARNWLLGGGKDFIYVCELAGYEADFVRLQAKRLLEAL